MITRQSESGWAEEGGLGLTRSAPTPKVTLKLPAEDDKEPANKRAKLNTEGIPDEYEVVMPTERVKNTFIFSENERVWVAKAGSGEDSQRRKHQKGECVWVLVWVDGWASGRCAVLATRPLGASPCSSCWRVAAEADRSPPALNRRA